MNWSAKGSFAHLSGLGLAMIAAAGLIACPGAASANEEKKEKKKKEVDFSELVPIPIGHGGEGIKVPQMDERGRLQMVFEIGTAFRVDEVNLRMEDLKIETFDIAGKSEMVIEMSKSMLDMKSRILTSKDPVLIRRTDFQITGGNATFDTRTRYGTFKGPVKMLIFDRMY